MTHRATRIPLRDFESFVAIVHRLRRECPWDREQTHESIRDMLIEEAYEVIEAIDERQPTELKDELGDLLLHVVMHATMAEEKGDFTLREVLRAISRKLVHRHPHVFGTRRVESATEVKRNWEQLKMEEGRSSILDGVPKRLPALQQALRVQERAARVGFDWEKKEDVWLKVQEELDELRKVLTRSSAKRREEELGDFLFAIVNYARFLGVNPESALRTTIQKFVKRFQFIERALEKEGRKPAEATLKEMDRLWNRAKRIRRPKLPGRRP
jgi:MazG family protein